MHLCLGVLAGLDNGCAVLAAIQESDSPADAMSALQRLPLVLQDDVRTAAGVSGGTFRLDRAQARAVLEIRFVRACRADRSRLVTEITGLARQIQGRS